MVEPITLWRPVPASRRTTPLGSASGTVTTAATWPVRGRDEQRELPHAPASEAAAVAASAQPTVSAATAWSRPSRVSTRTGPTFR